MRKLSFIFIILSSISCNHPIEITANPDDHTATSGTLGSAKSQTNLPPVTVDSLIITDTTEVADSLNNK